MMNILSFIWQETMNTSIAALDHLSAAKDGFGINRLVNAPPIRR
jgi:hypothetical protein